MKAHADGQECVNLDETTKATCFFMLIKDMQERLGNAVNVALPKNCSDPSLAQARRDIHGWLQAKPVDQADGVEAFLQRKYPHPKPQTTHAFVLADFYKNVVKNIPSSGFCYRSHMEDMAKFLYKFRATVAKCGEADSDINAASCYNDRRIDFVKYFETLEGKLGALKRTCQKQNFLMIQTLYNKMVKVPAVKLYFALKDFAMAQITEPPAKKQ